MKFQYRPIEDYPSVSQQQLKKIVGVKKSSQVPQMPIQPPIEMNKASRPTSIHNQHLNHVNGPSNQQFTFFVRQKSKEVIDHSSYRHLEQKRWQTPNSFANHRNNSIVDRTNDEIDLTYTNTNRSVLHQHPSNQRTNSSLMMSQQKQIISYSPSPMKPEIKYQKDIIDQQTNSHIQPRNYFTNPMQQLPCQPYGRENQKPVLETLKITSYLNNTGNHNLEQYQPKEQKKVTVPLTYLNKKHVEEQNSSRQTSKNQREPYLPQSVPYHHKQHSAIVQTQNKSTQQIIQQKQFGRLLFNDHLNNQNKVEISSRRNLSFNKFLDSENSIREKQNYSKSNEKSLLQESNQKRHSIAPFMDSVKKDELEIQQMVESLKQNILRDLQEVSKRFGSTTNCSISNKENDTSKNIGSIVSQNSVSDRFSFSYNNSIHNKVTANHWIEPKKVQSNKTLSPSNQKQQFQQDGKLLVNQLTKVLHNGKEFENQLALRKSKKQDSMSSPPPQLQLGRNNTPSFQKNSHSSLASQIHMPSPLQLSFNINDDIKVLASEEKPQSEQIIQESPIIIRPKKVLMQDEMMMQDKLIEAKKIRFSQSEEQVKTEEKLDIVNYNDDSKKEESIRQDQRQQSHPSYVDEEPEEEQICTQQTPRYSSKEQSVDPQCQVTINNLSSITPDQSVNPNKKINVSLESLFDVQIKETAREIEIENEVKFNNPNEDFKVEEKLEDVTVINRHVSFQPSPTILQLDTFVVQEQISEPKISTVETVQTQTAELAEEQLKIDIIPIKADTPKLCSLPPIGSANKPKLQIEIVDATPKEMETLKIVQNSASRQERVKQMLRDFKEQRCNSVHLTTKVEPLTPTLHKQHSIHEAPSIGHISDFIIYGPQTRESIQGIPNFSQMQRDRYIELMNNNKPQVTIQKQMTEENMVESINLKHNQPSEPLSTAQGNKLITFSVNDSGSESKPSLSLHSDKKKRLGRAESQTFFRHRHERSHCPSFRDVLRERDKSEKRLHRPTDMEKSSEVDSQDVSRRINFTTNYFSTQDHPNDVTVANENFSLTQRVDKDVQKEQNKPQVISFLQYLQSKVN